jgi:hypothetical protein
MKLNNYVEIFFICAFVLFYLKPENILIIARDTQMGATGARCEA